MRPSLFQFAVGKNTSSRATIQAVFFRRVWAGFELQFPLYSFTEAVQKPVGLPGLILIQILLGNIIFRYFVSVDFPFVGVVSALHTLDHAGLEGISFFNQLVYTFRIRPFAIR